MKAILIVTALLFLVGYLNKSGLTHAIAFTIVFGIFDFAMLTYIKARLEDIYGKSRAINLFVYGLGVVAAITFFLIILEN